MNNDTWIYIENGLLGTLWAQAHPPVSFPPAPIPDDAKLLSKGAVRGFWKDYVDSGTTYEVVNVVRPDTTEIDAFQQAHASDILAIYGWTQGNGLDNDGTEGGFITLPQAILDVMKDHDGSTPATFDNPNWGHFFLGQKERVFAGQFSLEFSREFF